jgi:recombination protein RecR
MNIIEKLTEYFTHFPGIGPRQARRFVYFLLTRNKEYLNNLSRLIEELKSESSVCNTCHRFFVQNSNTSAKSCGICNDASRNTSTCMVVERDADLENIERSGTYDGRYFVLGGRLPVLEKNPERFVKSRELIKHIKKNSDIKEVILAFSLNPDGEHTHEYIHEILRPLSESGGFSITSLGRGLSTGTELEYPDGETLKNALQNRH